MTRQDSKLKRQERTNHLRWSREEQRIVPQNSREEQTIVRQKSREEQRIVPQRSREEQRIVRQRSREEQRIVPERSREEQRIVRQRSRHEQRIVRQRSREEQRIVPQRSREEQRIISQRSREEQRIVPQKSRETERRLSERFSERRVIADPARFASRRSSERRIDDSLRSHDGSRMIDRRLERSPESRVSRDRRSSERRIDDNLKSRERSRIGDHHFEQSRKLQISRARISERLRSGDPESRGGSRSPIRARTNSESRDLMRMAEHKANPRLSSENMILRSSETRFDPRRDFHIRSQKEHAARSIEARDKELVRQQRQKSANLNNVREPSELVSLQRIIRASRIPSQIRKQPKLSADGTFLRAADNNLFAKWGWNLQNSDIAKNMKTWMETESLTYEFLKYLTNYDLMKQAFLVALCTIYGFSLYDGKKSNIG